MQRNSYLFKPKKFYNSIEQCINSQNKSLIKKCQKSSQSSALIDCLTLQLNRLAP